MNKDIKIVILNIISIFFYLMSLKGCNGTQSYCLVTLSPSFFYLLGVYMLIYVIILIYNIYEMIRREIRIIHLLYIIPMNIYLLYYIDTGSDLSHHGSYNKMCFYFLLLLCLIIFMIIKLMIYIYKYYKIIFISIIVILCSLIIGFNRSLKNECNKWYDGMNGMKLINNKETDKCYIVHPKKCFINILDGKLDVSRILSETCDNFRDGEKKELFKYLRKDLQNSYNLGYPITTNYTWLNESHFDRFFNVVMDNMIDLDNTNNIDSEITINFNKSTNYGNININIKKNEKLINERKLKYNSHNNKYKNILFIYIDAISRPEFIRAMKYTQNEINNLIKNENMNLYQMMKYQNFIFFTQQNTNPMFFGESMFNSNGTSILKAFKEKGYITGGANNICTRALYDIEDNYTENINFESFDHENIAMFCDPNFYNPENRFTPYIGPYSIKRRCLYGKDTFEYVLEYGYKFWETYINEPKFLRISFQDAHEGTLEVVKYLDKKLAIFLNDLHKNNYLKDTAIYFVSDHGNNMIGVYNAFQVEDYVLEKTLGSWFMLLPKNNTIDYTNLIYNQQKYVTPYDIHDTLLDMIGFKNKYYSRHGQSVFNKINGLNRNCDTYKQDLLPLWCRCIDY